MACLRSVAWALVPMGKLALAFSVIAVLLWLLFMLSERIPPRTMDANKLEFLRQQIIDYRAQHGHLPDTLGEVLAEIGTKHFGGKTGVDSNGKPIQYVRNGDSNFVVRIVGPWHHDWDGMTDELSARWPYPTYLTVEPEQ